MSSVPSRGLIDRLIDRIGRRLAAPHIRPLLSLRDDVDALRALVERIDRRLDGLAAMRKEIDKLAAAGNDMGRLGERIDRLLVSQKEEAQAGRALKRQVGALVRAQYFKAGLPAPEWLLARRFQLRSQHEEDGIVLALLEETGVGSRRFVEIGSGSSGGNCAVLAHDMGWSGAMVEIKPAAVRQLREDLVSNPGVAVLEAAVTPETVNALLTSCGISGEIDVLSIDIDSTDYWIFEALDVCHARIVVLEYNAHFGPTRAVTLPNAERPAGAPKHYFGASLAALERVARRKGYRLVLCEDGGVNAFFVREGFASAIPGRAPEEAYRPHRRRTRDRDAAPLEPDEVFERLREAGLPLVEV